MNDQELGEKMLVLHEVLDGLKADAALDDTSTEDQGMDPRWNQLLKGMGEVRDELLSRGEKSE